jgi:uncharacterized protein YjiS (DUF1127 family)
LYLSQCFPRTCIANIVPLRYANIDIVSIQKVTPMATIFDIDRVRTAPLPPLARVAFAVAQAVLTWETRRQTRRSLARLDPHLLHDIGLAPHLAASECEKPFWRG